MRTQSNTSKRRKALENARNQVAIGFSFASDWLKKWREISKPITERSKAKPMQSRITFDTQLKIALIRLSIVLMLFSLILFLFFNLVISLC